MKRIFKTFSSFLLSVLVLTALSVTAFAADSTITYEGMGDWEVSPGSGYTSSDLFDGFKNVMPGDKYTEQITIKNTSYDSDYIDVYLQAVLHDEQGNPLTYDEVFENTNGKDQAGVDGQRDETVATMHDFLSQLTMRVLNGQTVIYEASPDELGGLAEPVFLVSLGSGASSTIRVELEVPIDLDSKYAYRVGEVDWKFKIEALDDPIPPTDFTKLTAHKVWEDGSASDRPTSITVRLLRNGTFFDGRADAEVVLNADNQWTYTWSQLEDSYTWSVEEVSVPEGYDVEYKAEGTTVHIVNSKDAPIIPPDPDIPTAPVYLTVKKTWSGDEDALDKRPKSVGVTLYDGQTAVETIWLGDWNDWSYTWKDLDGSGDWGVLEIAPKGYSPSYSVSGSVITITNTATLIQTGQLNWPVPVLGGLGALMLAFGAYVILKKRKTDRA